MDEQPFTFKEKFILFSIIFMFIPLALIFRPTKELNNYQSDI